MDAYVPHDKRFASCGSNKRKQVSRACLNCQKAHSGCGEQRPCPRCVKRKEEHKCIDAPRKRKDNEPVKPAACHQRKRRCLATGKDGAIAETTRRQLAMRRQPRKQKWHGLPDYPGTCRHPFDTSPSKIEQLHEPMEKEEEEEVEEECGHVDASTRSVAAASQSVVTPTSGTPPYVKEEEQACPFYFDLNALSMPTDIVDGLKGYMTGEDALPNVRAEDVSALDWLDPDGSMLTWGEDNNNNLGTWDGLLLGGGMGGEQHHLEAPPAAAAVPTGFFPTPYQNCEALFPLRGF